MKIGVALYGAGMSGATGAGVLRGLLELGLHVDYVAGSGIGGLVALAYAAGIDCDAVSKAVDYAFTQKALEPTAFAQCPQPLFTGLYPCVDGFETAIKDLFQAAGVRTFKDLRLPAAVSCLDLLTGRLIVFAANGLAAGEEDRIRHKASVPVWAAARAALSPGGGYRPRRLHGMSLSDSAARSGPPVWLLRSMGAQRVIAVTPQTLPLSEQDLSSDSAVMARHAELAVQTVMSVKKPAADCTLCPSRPQDAGGVRIAAAHWVKAGQNAVEDHHAAILDALCF